MRNEEDVVWKGRRRDGRLVRIVVGLCCLARLPARQTQHRISTSISLRPITSLRVTAMEDQENAAPHDQKHAVSSSPPRSLPNHGAVTLPSNSSPNGDDRPIARQKRKRTSPEDQAVLEAYYVRDPKPDKTARLELVNKVALGEKEVQVRVFLTVAGFM